MFLSRFRQLLPRVVQGRLSSFEWSHQGFDLPLQPTPTASAILGGVEAGDDYTSHPSFFCSFSFPKSIYTHLTWTSITTILYCHQSYLRRSMGKPRNSLLDLPFINRMWNCIFFPLSTFRSPPTPRAQLYTSWWVEWEKRALVGSLFPHLRCAGFSYDR